MSEFTFYHDITDRFIEQAEQTHAKKAVIFEDKIYTYEDLLKLIYKYSDLLKNNPLKKGQIVGINMPRGVGIIAAMFAVWIQECGFYLIDDNLPESRREQCIKIANPVLLINSDYNIEYNSEYIDKHTADEIAYIIFTSGSTGIPKGVCISAHSVFCSIDSIFDAVDVNQQDVILAISNLSFDLIILETIIALCYGLKIVLANQDEYINPRLIIKLIQQHKVTLLQMVPSKLSLLVHYNASLTWLKSVNRIMIGGEIPPTSLLKPILDNTNCRIYNMYGLTEDTIWTTATEITNADKVYIGNEIKGHHIHLMKNSIIQTEVQEEGQIYITGIGLSCAYLNNEFKLKTIKINGQEHKALATGDYAVRDENGNVIFLGRKDNQVKINGNRIQIEEIECNAKKIDGITVAVVQCFENKHNSKILCLFYSSAKVMKPELIRDSLAETLPCYMVPAKYFQIEEFPYLPNGKVNRNSELFRNIFDNSKGV